MPINVVPADRMDAEQLAKRLGVSPDTVLTWARRGIIPRRRVVGVRRIQFNLAEVVRALQDRGREVVHVS